MRGVAVGEEGYLGGGTSVESRIEVQSELDVPFGGGDGRVGKRGRRGGGDGGGIRAGRFEGGRLGAKFLGLLEVVVSVSRARERSS